MKENHISQDPEEWMSNILQSSAQLKPLNPPQDLFQRIEYKIEIRRTLVSQKTILGIAASLLIIVLLNFILLCKHQTLVNHYELSYSEFNLSNQIY